ncbi:MAG: DUF4912 domain-containing protein [Rhodospirillales bacterium]|nr:DUF4912 domain-containing protein [Rhodospirillales bacterium]
MVLTPDELRRVAEEVRVAFPRPLRAPQLVLIDVDPRHLHAFWTLDAAAVEDARRQMDDHGRDAAMVLRTMEIGDDGAAETAFDVEVIGLQGQCYVDIWGDAREYRSELGLRRVDGGLWSLACPAHVELPRLGPAGDTISRAPVVDDTSPPPFVPPPPPSPVAEASPGLDREPVIHPFPQPPSAPGAYDPLALPETPSQAAETGEGAPQTSPFAAAAVAPPPTAAPEPPRPCATHFLRRRQTQVNLYQAAKAAIFRRATFRSRRKPKYRRPNSPRTMRRTMMRQAMMRRAMVRRERPSLTMNRRVITRKHCRWKTC